MKPISLEAFEKRVKEILQIDIKPKMAFYQFCASRGIVEYKASEINLCNNPNCENCMALDEAIKKELTKR